MLCRGQDAPVSCENLVCLSHHWSGPHNPPLFVPSITGSSVALSFSCTKFVFIVHFSGGWKLQHLFDAIDHVGGATENRWKRYFFKFLCICLFQFLCMSIYLHIRKCPGIVQWSQETEDDIRSLGTGVTDIVSCHVAAGNWTLVLCWKEQCFLTAEPSLQPQKGDFMAYIPWCSPAEFTHDQHSWRSPDRNTFSVTCLSTTKSVLE